MQSNRLRRAAYGRDTPVAGFGNPSFDLFKLSDEHNELRTVLRGLCEKEITPYAKDVDENARFPEEALKALTRADSRRCMCPKSMADRARTRWPPAS